ncbi:MAG TPA: hypothetical protein VIK55_11715 [Paludibacter sp.]
MKKIILIFVMLLFCFYLKGQDIKSDSTKFTYCELVGTGRLLSNKVTVQIDFGQVTKFFSDNRYKDPTTGKPVIFNSMIDALNFMGKDGWEFVQAYIVTEGSGTGSQNVYHFLLKKLTSVLEKEK